MDAGNVDYLQFRFKDIMEDEIFYTKKEHSHQNTALRKLTENTALQLSTGNVIEFDKNILVYQKEY